MSTPQPLSIKQWTSGVVDFLKSTGGGADQSLDKIVCSPHYLTCALKIAHSLASQMSTVEEERGYKQQKSSSSSQHRHYNDNALPVLKDTLEQSWADYISVYCATKAAEEKKDEHVRVTADISNNNHNNNNQKKSDDDWLSSMDPNLDPLPFIDDNFDTEDFQYLERQLTSFFSPENNNEQLIDYTDVRGAILNEQAVEQRPLSANGKSEIRSLGIAFCQLFSGGQVTAAHLGLDDGGGKAPARDNDIFLEGGSSNNPAVDSRDDGTETSIDDMRALGINEENPTKRRAQQITHIDHSLQKSMSRSSVESTAVKHLKLLGLPVALCDLISNMIDSVDGNTHGEEGYDFVSEVRDDLKSMIDSPTVYLHNFDLGEAARTGLRFGGAIYGREAELQTLKDAYQRSISNAFEMAMISGTSGVGKSELSREFARFTDRDGCLFLTGRFDKIQTQPLHAISSAFDNYCASLIADNHPAAEKVSAALKESMGEDTASLVTVMPSLANILGQSVDSKEIDTAVDAQKRLRYLFCQFVQIICKSQDKPVILFLDDCQWIDAASAGLLLQLVMSVSTLNYHRLFFFMSSRDDEINEDHPLNLVLSSVSSFGVNLTKIDLKPLRKDALNKMVSATLSLLPRITRPLADILHHKTKGGPLFAKQLMMELYKQRLLYPSLSRSRWDWDAEKIADMKIPENVATFISKSFDRLPPEVLSALIVLSCFGASAEVSLVEVLQKEINQPLVVPLEVAVAESVLGKKNGKFYFMHDKLQEAAYSMMAPKERCLHHNLYGQALGFVVMREDDDRYLLTAATQINFGGPGAVIDGNQAMVVAKLNLDAGKKAMSMSDFFAAHTFFNHGISYLRNGHWDEQYDVSLELFNLAAGCALMNADHERVRMLTGEIALRARCIQDNFRAICISVTLLLWSSKVTEAMDKIETFLSCLGEALPLAVPEKEIEHQSNDTKALLAGIPDEGLLNYPPMTLPSKIMAMELFSKQFINYSFAGNGDSMPTIPLRMVQTSLLNGMSSLAGVGFALYGNYLAIARGEVEEGYRYVKVALALKMKYPSTATDSEILYYSAHTKLRVEPMQSSIEHYSAAYKAAMATGSARFAFGCSFQYINCGFWSGKKLDLVITSMKETIKQMIFYKNFVMLALLQLIYQVSSELTGQSDENQFADLTNIFGESYNGGDASSKLPVMILTTCLVNFYEGLIFRDVKKAKKSVEKYISIQSLTARNMSNPTEFFRIFYGGLASLWVGREFNDKSLIKMGTECADEIDKLSFSASVWNFQNKSYLLQAEKQFCLRNFEEAEKMYELAIQSSNTHKFVNEEALANELAGRFYLETGRRKKSVNYFLRASENYREWGAVAKAASLSKYFDNSGRKTI